MNIVYRVGDATYPEAEGNKVIVHLCSDLGKWGKGFFLALSRRWKTPELFYKDAYARLNKPVLGNVQFVAVRTDLVVANIIGTHGIRLADDPSTTPSVRYAAVQQGLISITEYAIRNHASVHMPRIGCGFAGGTWEEIEPLILSTLISHNVATYVYDCE